MLTRSLGRSGVEVSAMGVGCWAIGGPMWRGETPVGWGRVDDNESIRAVRRAFELGITFFDTADAYGCGHSERLLGKALHDVRDRVVIATKFGNVIDEDTRQITGADASPDCIRQACEASLQRLNVDVIDLYQFHLGDYDLDRTPEVSDTLEGLVQAGKIRFYGWSTDDPARARLFADGPHCVAIQQQLNVLQGNVETLAVCERFGLASINRGPLAMGLLTGKYTRDTVLPDDDVRGPNSPGWMQYFSSGRPSPQWMDIMDAIREILTSKGRTLAQGALAWIWGRSTQTIPIPGFKTVAQIEQNAGALDFGPLTQDQMAEIDRVLGR